ncbi:unnamed protein product [Linum tenue]|uniref:Uncharacterized protein n=1 Tax=Linum tenue TaxID=586396 RepID=A0AAV0HVX2_9ROSI|nr:unnamed protein product [Linum tenue]
MLELAIKRSPPPQEIDIKARFDYNIDEFESLDFDGSRTYTIPRRLILPRFNPSIQLIRLKVLRLVHCNFDQFKDVNFDSNHFVDLGSSLRHLSLHRVSFLGGGRIVNSLIAGASLLQTLSLRSIVGIRRLQVRNLPNLNYLWFEGLVQDLEITGVPSISRKLVHLWCAFWM